MTRAGSKRLSAIVLAVALIPPMAIQFEFGAALGVMGIAAMCMLITLMKGWRIRSASSATNFGHGLRLVFLCLLLTGLWSAKLQPAFDFARFAQSLIFMAFCMVGAYHFGAIVRSSDDRKADQAFRLVFMVILCSSLAKVLGIYLSGNHRSVFFYNEPSHYAVSLAPFLMYMVVTDAKRRWLWMIAGVAVGLSIQNLTLIVAVLLIFLVVMRVSFMTIIFTMLVAALGAAMGDGLSYYTDRAALSSESTNLSNLVYLSGWERAQLSLEETRGLGYGFNQLGIVGDQGEIMLILSTLNAEGLNALDGGAVASKLLAEFGALGVLLLLIYARFFIRGVRVVRIAAHEAIASTSRIEVFFWSCIIMYSVDLFVRGSGYFTAESFMFFGAIWGLTRRNRKRKTGARFHRRFGVQGTAQTVPVQ